jgi:hypothetical protein
MKKLPLLSLAFAASILLPACACRQHGGYAQMMSNHAYTPIPGSVDNTTSLGKIYAKFGPGSLQPKTYWYVDGEKVLGQVPGSQWFLTRTKHRVYFYDTVDNAVSPSPAVEIDLTKGKAKEATITLMVTPTKAKR